MWGQNKLNIARVRVSISFVVRKNLTSFISWPSDSILPHKVHPLCVFATILGPKVVIVNHNHSL